MALAPAQHLPALHAQHVGGGAVGAMTQGQSRHVPTITIAVDQMVTVHHIAGVTGVLVHRAPVHLGLVFLVATMINVGQV